VNDQELRQMIRQSIARHLGSADPHPSRGAAPIPAGPHASHALLPLIRSGDDDGACLIEPAVRCNHCGYCLSYGH
jgi:hypothetical protein